LLKVTIKGLLAHKLRLVTTATAVMLGVAFMSGVLVLTDTIGKTFDELFADVNAGVDTVVRKEAAFDDQFAGEQRGQVPEDLVATVADAPGVDVAEGQVIGFAQFVDEDGEPIGDPVNGAPTFGFNWSDDPQLSSFELAEGEPPGPDEVVADAFSAEQGGFEVGDDVQVVTQGGVVTLRLSGIATFGDADSPGGASAAMFQTATAQELVGTPGEFAEIWVTGEEGVSQEELAASVQSVLPEGEDLEAITGAEYTKDQQDQIKEFLGFFSTFLLIFALVALFVGSFIIYNTFSIIVAQRGREMALLRAVGAGRAQVLSSVLIEALVVGLIASGLGLVVGIGLSEVLKAALSAIGGELPSTSAVIAVRTVVLAFVVGTGVTMVAAVVPARRASRVPPIAAMRDIAVDDSGSSTARLIIGLVITGFGALLILGGLFGKGDNAAATVGFGVPVTFIGVFVLGPRLAVPFTKALGAPLPRLKGMPGTLARENALRNPKRTAATAAALMIGIGIVVFIAILAQSLKTSAFENIDESFQGDLAIDSGTFGFGGLPPQLAEDLRALPEVDAASGLRLGYAQVGLGSKPVYGVDPEQMFDIVDVGLLEGDLSRLGEPGTIAVAQDSADLFDWGLGAEVPVRFAATGDQRLEVVAVFDDSEALRSDFSSNFIIGMGTWDQNFDTHADFQVYVECAGGGADVAACRDAVETVTDEYPTATVQNLEELKQSQADQVNQLLTLVFVLLFLAIVIATLGIANTLALSIHERTRELGLLRAVGMTRRQMRSSVRWEAVIISLFGTSLGLIVGVLFSFALQQAVKDEGVDVYDVPIFQIVLIVVLGAALGVIASLRPAHRAAKLEVLDAIATE
jgi:putative ABC transport system permease protein